MSVFASVKETRQLGAPIVALFRTAFARDPSPIELATLAPLVRDRVPLATIAADIVAGAEFRNRFGGLSLAARVQVMSCNAFGPTAEEWGDKQPVAGTDAELLAVIADVALARHAIPLLPGLAPGTAPDDDVAYDLWVCEYDSTREPAPACEGLLVSLLMAAGDTEAELVERTVMSLQAQTHQQWELCLAVRTLSPWSARTIAALTQDERRLRLIDEHDLWTAFDEATGSLLGILAPGDKLVPNALARITAAFGPEIGMVFTDEDVEDAGGRHSPRFKPGFSPDFLLDGDAIGRLAIVRRDLMTVPALRPTELTDRALACHAASCLSAASVRHLPFVALHRGQPGQPLTPDLFGGAVVARPDPPPLVTSIVLTKDHPEVLATCVQGLLERTAYPALELILVDNGTTEPAALALLAELERHPRVRVLRQPGPFNFAALNNAAAAGVTKGPLLLLNNDVEVLDPAWLSEMIAQLARPGVGIVGARLLYPDHTIQHAGIVLGPAGAATHVGRGASATATGYLGQLTGVRDFSAVTGACLAITAETWRLVGGMDERFAVTWNDIDLCLRVRRAGLRVVWTPRATLIHRESTTRGLEAADAAKLARFREEQALMRAEWGDTLEHDPFLNANLLALDSGELVLTKPRSALALRP